MSKPLLFFAFANDGYESGRYLRNLSVEVNGLRDALRQVEQDGNGEFLILESATLKSIVDVFQDPRYRNRIAVFHFAGHAGADRLLLQDLAGNSTGGRAAGLVPFLANQQGLQLVFLNGCHTGSMAADLSQEGIPMVIGTNSAVRDDVATELSVAFYRGIAAGLELEPSWREAKQQVMALAENDQVRTLYRTEAFREDMSLDGHSALRFPWRKFITPGREDVRYWNLPRAAGNPLFGLPSVADQYDLPNEPYRYLAPYEVSDTRVFFGRGREISEAYHRLLKDQSVPLLLMHGQSGVGKSSFLKAGLLPRLQKHAKVLMTRRSKDLGLKLQVQQLLQDQRSDAASSSSPLQQWHQIEEQTGQPLVIVVDQLEETFTRPQENQDKTAELVEFLALLNELFQKKDQRPLGSMVLSYRKAFHPEIEAAVRTAGLPYEKQFIKRLDGNGISEIITGLTSTKAHRDKYNLSIEEGLPATIATDLQRDPNSPIALVLQILLTKLWAQGQREGACHFSLADYQALHAQGIFLEDFFKQQLEQFRLWDEANGTEVVASGLALDILNYHVTELNTADARQLNELEQQYQHTANAIPAVVQQLKDLYLLVDAGSNRSSLAHDTLAPIVQDAIRASDLPGQRAFRLLQTKMLEYEQRPETSLLAPKDLQTVEDGQAGMRQWTATEQAMIERSRKYRAEEERRALSAIWVRRALVAAVAAAGIIFYFAWRNSDKQAQVSSLISKALQLEQEDPVTALAYAKSAVNILPDDPIAIQTRHDIYSNQELYEHVLTCPAVVSAIALSPDETLVAVASGQNIQLYRTADWILQEQWSGEEDFTRLAFLPNGDQVVAATDLSGTLQFFDLKGNMTNELATGAAVLALEVSPDGQYLISSDNLGGVSYWNLDGEQRTIWDNGGVFVESVAISSSGDTIVLGDELGNIIGIDQTGMELWRWSAHQDRVLDLKWSEDGQRLFSSSRDGLAISWSLFEFGENTYLAGHERRVNALTQVAQTGWVLTASDDRAIRLWDQGGTTLRTYYGHQSYVLTLEFVKSKNLIVSGGADSTLRVWPIERKTEEFYLADADQQFSRMDISEDGETLLVGSVAQDNSDFLLDENFDLNDFFEANTTAPQDALLYTAQQAEPILLSGHEASIRAVQINPAGDQFFTGDDSGVIKSWDREGNMLREYSQQGAIDDIDCSPDGTLLLTGGEDMRAVVWEISNGKVKIAVDHPDRVAAVAFSPDNQTFVTGCYDNVIRVFSKEGTLLDALQAHGSRVSSLAYSADGAYLFSGGWDNQIIRWSTSDWAILNRYLVDSQNKTGGQQVRSIAVNTRLQWLAVALEGGQSTVFNWNGQKMFTHKALPGTEPNNILFDPTSETDLLISTVRGIRRWSVPALKH